MKVLEVIKKAVEDEPWDEVILESESFLNRAAWIAIIVATIYFAPEIIDILTR